MQKKFLKRSSDSKTDKNNNRNINGVCGIDKVGRLTAALAIYEEEWSIKLRG